MSKLLFHFVFLFTFYPATGASTPTLYAESAPEIENEVGGPFQLGLIAGVLNYPGVVNIETLNMATGFQIGARLGSGFLVHGDFLYAFQNAEINRIANTGSEDIDQYMITTGLQFDWLSLFSTGLPWFKLQTGLLITHNRRQYNFDENASQGWDGGASLALNFQLNRSVSLGLEYRYMQNLSYKRDRDSFSNDEQIQSLAARGGASRLEDLDYQLFIAGLKYNFAL